MNRKTKLAGAVAIVAIALVVGLGIGDRTSGEAAAPRPTSAAEGGGRIVTGPASANAPRPAQSGTPVATTAGPTDGPRPGPPRFVGSQATSAGAGTTAEGMSGSMKPEDVTAGLVNALPAIKACYDKQLQLDPRLAGRLVLKLSIVEREGAGRVSDATIVPAEGADGGPELVSTVTEHCVLNALVETRFVAPVGGPVEVSFPLVFTAAQEDHSPRR